MSKGLTTAPFTLELRAQRHWDWKVAFYLYGAGSSAGLIFLELLLRRWNVIDEATALWGMWMGLVLALVSLAFLFSHLGPSARWRFLYVFRKPGSSWIARGAIIVTVLVLLRILILLPSVPGFTGLPWGEETGAGAWLRAGVMLFAFAFMAYSGLVLSSWNAIAFWNTPLLPVLYIAYSFLAGLAALPLVALATHGVQEFAPLGSVLWPFLLTLLVVNGLLLLVYVWGMATATLAARESVRRLLSGEHRWSFWIGVVGVGLILPIVMIGLASGQNLSADPATAIWLATACGAIQIGGFLLRDNFLRVGIYGYPV
jgi:polysulfide reductase chain C